MVIGCQRTSSLPLRPEEEKQSAEFQQKSVGQERVEETRCSPVRQSTHTVIAYYFHRTVRCLTCLQVEFMTTQVLRDIFPEPLEQGELLWLVLNIDEPENQDFIREFHLDNINLILAEMRTDQPMRWKKLDAVWELLDDPKAYTRYLREEVSSYLKGSPETL